MAALPFGSANKQAPILRSPPHRVRHSVAGEHRRQMPSSGRPGSDARVPVEATAHDTPGCQSIAWGHAADAATSLQRTQGPAKFGAAERAPGTDPRVNHSSPLARFQGRKRRKAPEGFPKPTSRSAKRLSTHRRRTILPSRSPDFKGVNAGRPRVILLSDSAAAKRRGPAKEKTRGLPMGSQALTA